MRKRVRDQAREGRGAARVDAAGAVGNDVGHGAPPPPRDGRMARGGRGGDFLVSAGDWLHWLVSHIRREQWGEAAVEASPRARRAATLVRSCARWSRGFRDEARHEHRGRHGEDIWRPLRCFLFAQDAREGFGAAFAGQFPR